jgi:putative zinc finger/helix-turn-helix YgiT family protein
MNRTAYCSMCEADREVRAGTVREEYKVRGETIAVDVPRLTCGTCGESPVDDAFGDPTLHVYAEYRRRHGLLSPEQIRAIRGKYDLSQDAFATLLGTSPATLARYEGGSLQDKAYDHLIRACDNPTFVADLVARESQHLSPGPSSRLLRCPGRTRCCRGPRPFE